MKRTLVAAFLLAVVPGVSLDAAFPPPQKYVSDGSRVIDGNTTQAINERLRTLERDTAAEVVVVTVDSLDDMTIEDYAVRLFKEWGIGKRGKDNGVLILVAPTARKMRIEVGYGLEPILPDGLAGEIIRQEFTPAFKSGDYSRGISGGVARIAGIVREKHVVTAEERKRYADDANYGERPPTLLTTPFFGVFVGVGAFMLGAGFASKTGFPLMFGGLFGGIPFLMSLIPFFNVTRVLLIPWMLLCAYFGWTRGGQTFSDLAKAEALGAPGATTKRGRRRGSSGSSSSGWTWGVGSGSGSSGGSSGSSSSGGSFGGGSSGGGGASGSW